MERVFETRDIQLPSGKHTTYRVSKHVDMLRECLRQGHRHVRMSGDGLVPVTIEDLTAAIPTEDIVVTIDRPAEIILPEYREEWVNKLDEWLERDEPRKWNLYLRFKNWIKEIVRKW